MNKFWKWMQEKEYCDVHQGKNKKMVYGFGSMESSDFNFSKQMLIGYMIEYLIECDKFDELRDETEYAGYCKTDLSSSKNEVKKYYEDLKQKIEEIN